MAQKRKAREAFRKSDEESSVKVRPKSAVATIPSSSSAPVSAFAAARLARERKVKQEVEHVDAVHDNETIVQPSSNQFDALLTVQTAKVEFSRSLPQSLTSKINEDGLLSSVLPDRLEAIGPYDDLQTFQVELHTDDYITFVGEYDLKVISGSITLYGATLHQQSGTKRVAALSTHALPQIVARKPSTTIQVRHVDDSIIGLAAHSQLFRNISSSGSAVSFEYLQNIEGDALHRNLSPLETTSDARKALSQFALKVESERGRNAIMAVGAKSSGKSTFNRQLCNTILTRTPARKCFYIDLDPGQPEFGPPGQVYLIEVSSPVLGPSYSHFATSDQSDYRLIAAHSIAATTFKDDPGYYVSCAEALFLHPELKAARSEDWCPIVVNSCGWVNGLGARVLKDIFDLGVTDVAILGTIDADLEQHIKRRAQPCYVDDRPISRFVQRTPAELRQMQTMAYFHSHGEYATSITSLRPWIIPYAGSPHSVRAFVSYSQTVDEHFLAEVLSGSIVAIASSSIDGYSKTDENRHCQQLITTPEELPLQATTQPLDPYRYQYEGLALVRSIDVSQRQLQLVTPISGTRMTALRDMNVVLIRGGFDSPDWAYLADINAAEPASQRPWVAKSDMTGIEGAVWRLRHTPSANKILSNR